MNGSWMTTYEIASKRHHTKLGENHLTDNGLCILQGFVQMERQDAMDAAAAEIQSRFLREIFSGD